MRHAPVEDDRGIDPGLDRADAGFELGDHPPADRTVGAQGGDIEATVKSGKTGAGAGMMISSSRAILYAAPVAGEDFAAAAGRVALETRDAINLHR